MFQIAYIATSGKLMFRMGNGKSRFYASSDKGVEMLCNTILVSICNYMEFLIIKHSMQMELLPEFRQACRRIAACKSGKLEMLERELNKFSFAVSPTTYRIERQAKIEINNLIFFTKRAIQKARESNMQKQNIQLSLNFSES